MIDIALIKSRFPITPLIDVDIDVGGFGLVGISGEDHELRANVTAAVIARAIGYKSIDYVKKKYSSHVKEYKSHNIFTRDIMKSHLNYYNEFYSSFPPRTGERLGVFAFDLALVRSRASIELMLSCSNQGFLIEPCLIGRSLIEQFAYALHVWSSDDDGLVFHTKPQSKIAGLKCIHSGVGLAYGLLSRLAHYDPQMHYEFIIDVDDDGNTNEQSSSAVTQRSWRFKITSIAWFMFILDLKYRLFRFHYGSHPNFTPIENKCGSMTENFDVIFDGVDSPAIEQIRTLIAGD